MSWVAFGKDIARCLSLCRLPPALDTKVVSRSERRKYSLHVKFIKFRPVLIFLVSERPVQHIPKVSKVKGGRAAQVNSSVHRAQPACTTFLSENPEDIVYIADMADSVNDPKPESTGRSAIHRHRENRYPSGALVNFCRLCQRRRLSRPCSQDSAHERGPGATSAVTK